MVMEDDLTERKKKRMRKMMKMEEASMPGRELTQMTDPGSLCKRMNLASFAQLTTKLSTMLSTAGVCALSPLPQLVLEFRRASFATFILSLTYPGCMEKWKIDVVQQGFYEAASEMDFKPSRMVVVAKQIEAFIREFFDQNPLSQIGLVIIKDGVAQCLTDLGGSPESHVKALMGKLECSGDSSLQNALDLVCDYLCQIPSYGHREVLILYSALSTCDPGDIMETIQKCKKSKIRCSVICLSTEIFICKYICQETCGLYSVALDEVSSVNQANI
ncbi:hypothetical protein RHGRI_036493 [Rhododendron griersonianum]|uniref:Ssl1-like domain-containing protein n=1 Tax=Rhododendron griersonianum TaxID=479676 RepID=A0AAV6HNY9_9ERIC|nr:hypothetical protein RHGRI_036493 [Rhododendron griersonianum]